MGGGHNCKLARSGAAQRLKLTVRQLASKMATGGCVARSPVLHRAGQKVAYSVSGYLVSCSNRLAVIALGRLTRRWCSGPRAPRGLTARWVHELIPRAFFEYYTLALRLSCSLT